jgi:metal-responsive CopG/Arc/MetJ family transcriptional regulator
MQEKQLRRVWPALPEEVYADLEEVSSKEKRKPSEMAAILIENALKERKRKRKDGKENNASDNA